MIIVQILAFLFFIVLVLVILAVFTLRRVLYKSGLGRIFELFKGRMGQQQPTGQNPHRPHHTTTANGDTVIDRRSPEKANQKIFDKSEGEYVDYKEE